MIRPRPYPPKIKIYDRTNEMRNRKKREKKRKNVPASPSGRVPSSLRNCKQAPLFRGPLLSALHKNLERLFPWQCLTSLPCSALHMRVLLNAIIIKTPTAYNRKTKEKRYKTLKDKKMMETYGVPDTPNCNPLQCKETHNIKIQRGKNAFVNKGKTSGESRWFEINGNHIPV